MPRSRLSSVWGCRRVVKGKGLFRGGVNSWFSFEALKLLKPQGVAKFLRKQK
jgi:hypothetical protein